MAKYFFFSQTLIQFVQLQGLPKYIILKKMLHFTNDINSCDRPHLATRELNSARTESSGRMTLCGSKWTQSPTASSSLAVKKKKLLATAKSGRSRLNSTASNLIWLRTSQIQSDMIDRTRIRLHGHICGRAGKRDLTAQSFKKKNHQL